MAEAVRLDLVDVVELLWCPTILGGDIPVLSAAVRRDLTLRRDLWFTASCSDRDPPMAMLEFDEAAARQIQRLYSTPDVVQHSEPYPDAGFDAAVSTQVYEYVADVPTALTELHRVLRPGGRALIQDTDSDSVVWHVADRERHRRIMAAWEEHLVHPHLPPALPGHLRRAGFAVTGRSLIPLFNPTYEPNTYSAMIMDVMAEFVSGRQNLTREDIDGWRQDLRSRGEDDDYLFSINRYCFLAEAT